VDVQLEVRLVKAKDNRLADALSRLAPGNHPAFTSEIKTLLMDGREARQEGETMIKKITAASLVHKYTQDEETAHLVPLNTPDQESSRNEMDTGETTSWELAEEVVSPTGSAVHVPSMSARSDIDGTPNMDGFEQTELPTETPRNDFNALFRAMERSKAAKAKVGGIRRRAINIPERTLIEAAETMIKQAQELVKAAEKLVKAAGKKK